VPVVSVCSCLAPVAAGTASLFVNLTSLTQSLLRNLAVEVANRKVLIHDDPIWLYY
jgi:hypothetical protein